MNAAQILVRIVDRPEQAMRGAAERPRSWLLPAVLLILSMIALAVASAPYAVPLANERQTQMIERITQSMSAEQAKTVRSRARDMTTQRFLLTTVGVAATVAALGWVGRGAIVHFSGMAAGGMSTWGPTFCVGVWSMLPFFVRDLLQIAYVLINKGVLEHQGLGFLVASGDWLKDGRSIVYGALSQVDPFVLWHLVLLAVAISVATHLSKAKAVVMAAIVWGLFLGLKLLPVAIGSAVAGRFLG